MRSSIRPDEFAKYAPRWVREGKSKPKQGKGLPPAAQLPPVEAGEPPWRGPSPFQDGGEAAFDGDIRHWRSQQSAEPHLTHQLPLPVEGSFGPQMGIGEKLFRAAAILSFAIVAVGALSMVLFPDAPKDAAQIGNRLAAMTAERTISQFDKRPGAKSTARIVADDNRASKPVQSAITDTAPKSLAPQPLAPQSLVPQTMQPGPDKGFVVASAATQMSTATAATSTSSTTTPAFSPQRVHSQRIISPDELDRLMKRGEAFLEQGDVAAARLVFARAAEAREARAALALGSTYDPNVLKKMGVVGVQADPEQARTWYERAAEYGSDDAGSRLSALAQLGR